MTDLRTPTALVNMAIGLALVACRNTPASTVDAGASALSAASSHAPVARALDASSIAPGPLGDTAKPPAPRCKVVSTGAALGAGVDGVLVGDLVPTASGFAVGVLRSTGASTSATVAVLPEDMATATMVDLGAHVGDSPPPRPFVVNGQLFAASYVPGRADGGTRAGTVSRTVGFFRVEGDKGRLGATLEQSVDDSAAMDVAGGTKGALVAWDEAGPSGDAGKSSTAHGVIKVAAVDPGQIGDPGHLRATPRPPGAGSRVVSPETSDADEPKVAARDGGYWVAWLAHHSQASPDASVAAELEGPAEARESRWIEIIPLDDAGKAAGPVRRLTPPSGHVSAFTLVPRPTSSQGQPTLDVFARDDEESSEGAGGRILRIGVRLDATDPPAVLVADGAGRGAPEVMPGAGPTLVFYADTADHARILELGEGGATLGPSTLEPALGEARPLSATRTTKDGPGLFAVFPGEHTLAGLAPVRAITCAL